MITLKQLREFAGVAGLSDEDGVFLGPLPAEAADMVAAHLLVGDGVVIRCLDEVDQLECLQRAENAFPGAYRATRGLILMGGAGAGQAREDDETECDATEGFNRED